MRPLAGILLFLLSFSERVQAQPANPEALAEELLLAVRRAVSTNELETRIASLTVADLYSHLKTDARRTAFWLNVYNAWYQLLADRGFKKNTIFSTRIIPVAETRLSLDDIEHGILRRFQYKYGLGYIRDLVVPEAVRRFAVSVPDARIHFALNCGAASCPPIAVYQSPRIEQQLTLATLSFLRQESHFDEKTKTLTVSRIFQWFGGDFGGKAGVRALHETVFRRSLQGWTLAYSPYDWSPRLRNFAPADSLR